MSKRNEDLNITTANQVNNREISESDLKYLKTVYLVQEGKINLRDIQGYLDELKQAAQEEIRNATPTNPALVKLLRLLQLGVGGHFPSYNTARQFADLMCNDIITGEPDYTIPLKNRLCVKIFGNVENAFDYLKLASDNINHAEGNYICSLEYEYRRKQPASDNPLLDSRLADSALLIAARLDNIRAKEKLEQRNRNRIYLEKKEKS